jgi:hypothetical protein
MTLIKTEKQMTVKGVVGSGRLRIAELKKLLENQAA